MVNVFGEDGGLFFAAGIDTQQLQKDAQTVNNTIQQMLARMEQSQAANQRAFQQEIAKLNTSLRSTTQAAEQESAALEGLGRKAATALAAYTSFAAASDFLSNIISVRSEFQRLQAVLSNSFGSDSEAQEALQMISDYVAKTPFELSEVSNAYVKLVNQGLKPTTDQLTKLGDLAASTGKGFDQLAEAILDAQTGEFERLKEFGIRASKSGDQVAFTFKGVTQQVQFSSKAIQDYIIGLGSIQGVAGATAKISETLGGKISNLRDAWTRMLNDIGQSGEGVFSDAIGAATLLVQNYQSVIKVLEELVFIYGAYKAAMYATIAIKKIDAAITGEITIAERLRSAAILTSQKAMALLNRTLLLNPTVAVVTAVSALVGALLFLEKETLKVKDAQELLNEAQQDVSGTLAKQESEITHYVGVLSNQNIAEETRLTAYNKLKEIAPDIIGQLSFQAAKTTDLTNATNQYIASLRQRLNLESNQKAYQAAIDQQKAAEKNLLEKQQEAQRFSGAAGSYGRALLTQAQGALDQANAAVKTIEGSIANIYNSGSKQAIQAQIDRLDTLLKATDKESTSYKKYSEELNNYQKALADLSGPTKKAVSVRNEEFLKNEIKRITDLRAPLAVASKEYKDYTEQINRLQNELNPAKAAKAAQAEENKTNKFLEQRKDLLQEIADMQRAAQQSGQPKEISELDKINERYDNLILKISEYNAKAKKVGAAQVGLTDINRLNDARTVELQNASYEQDAARYKKSLEDKKALFERYEADKSKIGLDYANKLLGEETQGFQSYLAYLKSEGAKLMPKIVFGIANKGEVEKFRAISKEISEENNRAAKQQQQDFVNVINATATYSAKKKAIEDNYQKQVQDLEKLQTKFTAEEYAKRMDLLTQSKDDELAALEASLTRQSDLFRKLGTDTIAFTKQQAQARVKELQEVLKSGTFINADGLKQTIPPELLKQLEEYIKRLQEAYDLSSRLRTAELFTTIGSGLSSIASELGSINEGLGQTIGVLSNLANAAGSTLKSIETLSSKTATVGEKVGAGFGIVGAAVGVVTSIVGIFKKSAEERRRAAAEYKQFQNNIFLGEIQVNELYRQRTLEQAKLNKLRLDGINAEIKALQDSKPQIQADFDRVFKQLQQQKFTGTEQQVLDYIKSHNLSITQLPDLLKKRQLNLSDFNFGFDELEKLFLEGRLDASAKQFFETLQKLKQAGADVDAQIEAAKQKAAELFTGTTAQSLADSIRDGLKQGYRSVADFGDNLEETFRNAILSGFEAQVIDGRMQDFYKQLNDAAQSGGGLDKTEIADLKSLYETKLQDILSQFDQLQSVTGVGFGQTSSANSLAGSIKGITEQTAEVLGGRLAGIQFSASKQLDISMQSLQVHQRIEANTAATVARLDSTLKELAQHTRFWQDVTTGAKVVHVK